MSAPPLSLPPRARILVVALRRLGDVLLTTPLIRSLRRAWRRGNVWLVQNPLPCLPCQQEGCDRHRQSRARCLDELTPRQVLTAVDQALARQSEMVAP